MIVRPPWIALATGNERNVSSRQEDTHFPSSSQVVLSTRGSGGSGSHTWEFVSLDNEDLRFIGSHFLKHVSGAGACLDASGQTFSACAGRTFQRNPCFEAFEYFENQNVGQNTPVGLQFQTVIGQTSVWECSILFEETDEPEHCSSIGEDWQDFSFAANPGGNAVGGVESTDGSRAECWVSL